MAAKDYANTRYSGLNEITAENVGSLKPAWTFSTGVLRGQEAAPLVVNGTMYVITPYPNILYALDLTKPGAPTKWVYKPKPSAAAQGVACCDTVNRGAAYADGKIFFNALDAHTIAVDAETGKEVWKTMVGDFRRGETTTMAPIVAKGKVIVGASGGELGIRGVERLASRVMPIPLGSVKLSLDTFSHEAGFIELPIDCESDPHLLRAEKWLRTHVVERIPGGMAEKST